MLGAMTFSDCGPSRPLVLFLLGVASALPGVLDALRYGIGGMHPNDHWFFIVGGSLLLASLADLVLRAARRLGTEPVEHRFND